MKKTNVLMCGSRLEVKGGMVSVIKNYLGHKDWKDYNIIYVPTHIEKHKLIVSMYFAWALFKIFFVVLFGNIKIAHLHTAERGSFFRKAILVRILHKFGIKTIMHHHAAEFEEFYANLSEEKKKFVNETLELADVNIVLSNRLITMITEKSPKANVEVLYNAVNTYEENPYNEDGKGILFLGRLGERKGAYDALEMIKNIDKKIPEEIKFYLCGDGEVQEIRSKIAEYGIEHRIAHVGWINGEEKVNIFKDTIINMLPSYNEGLPMTILETMAYGIPNISTNIASIPEVIADGENGYLIEPGDVEALSEKIITLVTDKDLRCMFSNKSYELLVDKFSMINHIQQVCDIYAKVGTDK